MTTFTSPIALQSWPASKDESEALSTLIARVNTERGSFRSLSEEGLRNSIAQAEVENQEAGESTSQNDVEMEDTASDTHMEVKKAQIPSELAIANAHQSAMFAVDFVSLLLTKYLPGQANVSVSPALRNAVDLETLAADKISASRITDPDKEVNRRIASGIKLQSLQEAADSMLVSATRLEKAIASETNYWQQVLAIKENGWAVCRAPHAQHTLGVRFGFQEATPAFRNRSFAVLERNAEGDIHLDQAVITAEPKYVQVRVERDGIVTGCNRSPDLIMDDAPIEAHILQQRNAVFSEELWHELHRETRIIGSYGVRSSSTCVSCPLSAHSTLVFEFIPIAEETVMSRTDDQIAEGVSLALHLLLSQAHRQCHRRRSQKPAPLSDSKGVTPPYTLIRPLIARLRFEENLSALDAFLNPLMTSINAAAPPEIFAFTITRTPPPLDTELLTSIAERTLVSITDFLESVLEIKPGRGASLKVVSRTAISAVIATSYIPSIKPEDSTILEYCRPPSHFNEIESLKTYIMYACACMLASSYEQASYDDNEDEETDVMKAGRQGWYRTSQPNILRKSFKDKGRSKQLCFDAVEDSNRGGVKLIVRWEWMGRFTLAAGGGKRMGTGEGVYEWVGKKSEDATDADLGEVVRTLDDVVEAAGQWIS